MIYQPNGLITPLFKPAIIRPGVLMKVKPKRKLYYLNFPDQTKLNIQYIMTGGGTWLFWAPLDLKEKVVYKLND